MFKLLLLDFGNVLYEINVDLTKKALSELFNKEIKFAIHDLEPVFLEYEAGLIDTNTFIKRIKELYGDVKDEDFIDAWNKVLIKPFPWTLEFIKNISKQYKVALLSNASEIHYNKFYSESKEFLDLMDKTYFSFQMGMRKPDLNIYKKVIEDYNLLPEEIMFIDDNLENVEAASSLGIRTYHLINPEELPNLY